MQILEEQRIYKLSQLSDYFNDGCKVDKKIGLEFEKLPVNNSTNKAVNYFYNNGIKEFLKKYKNWGHFLPCVENNFLLGLIMNTGTITLEPGSQVEISLKPQKEIKDIEESLNIYNYTSAKIADMLGISFLGLGIQPVSIFSTMQVLPKKRYEFMTRYLKQQAKLPFVMMRETAGVQVSIDYENEYDAILKLSTALKLSPFLSAFYSNSPIRNGKLSNYKSYRANAWLNTDNDRCGLIAPQLFEYNPIFSFQDYTDIILNTPMIFNKNAYLGKTTFNEFLKSNEKTTLSDWETQLSLYFSDVRLKKYIEIRNHDSQMPKLALSVPALYKGIMYSDNGINNVNNLLKNFIYSDYETIRQLAPKYGLNFSIKNIKIVDIIREIFNIAVEGLKEFNLNEEKYLESALELIEDGITPADIIIKNFTGSWNGKIEKLIEYSKIK